MFVSIELENIGPYTNKAVFDFKINKKDKKNLESTVTLPDGTIISRIIGVIAGNASGKSTLINSLTSVGAFINRPVRNQLEEQKKIIRNSLSEESEIETINSYLQKNIPLKGVNLSKKDNVGTIKLEMYIDSNDDYEGYYQYIVKYNSNVNAEGIILEQLDFKKKYTSKYNNIFQSKKGSRESEIGSKIAKKQSWIIELESAKMDTKSFEERMKYYETFYNRYLNESAITHFYFFVEEEEIAEIVQDEKDIFKKILRIVDNSIVDIESDIDSNEKKVFIVYDGYKLRYDYLSTATKKICDFIYNFVVSSKKGGVLLSDEFDSSLNREVAKTIINIYFDSNIKKTGQFIFTAITPEIFDKLRRDQIFILTKRNNVVDLTRFDEFRNPENNKLVRNDFSFTKAYNNNIINNYPVDKSIKDFVTCMEER